MAQFKLNDVKKVGKVQISAKKLMELADKLKGVRETEDNVDVDLYLVPNEETNVSQIAFDFSKEIPAVEPVVELPAEEVTPKVEPVVPEVAPVEAPAEAVVPVVEPVVAPVVAPVEAVAPVVVPVVEPVVAPVEAVVPVVEPVVAPVVEVKPAPTEEEIAVNAKKIDDNMQKGLNPEAK